MKKISENQKHQFREEGFMIVPDFLEPTELETIRKICNLSIKKMENDMNSRGIKEDGINVLGRKYFINNTRKEFPELPRIIFSEKTAEVCKATIGDTAYLHNEQFVVKMNDDNTSFAWHQDSGYSVYNGGASAHSPYLTCWIALDDMHESNGTISLLPFRRAPSTGLIEHCWDSKMNAMVGYQGNDPGETVEVPAGTLVGFSSFLLHKSGANITQNPRRSYFIAFTPELFSYRDKAKGIYNSGEPLIKDGKLIGL